MKREQIEDAIVFANTLIKAYYNKSHIAMKLARDNIIYLRLHHEYGISSLVNRKLHHQRIDPFKILEKIKSLTYHLKLSSIIKIHSIMSIIQLKSVSKNDSYNRIRNTNLFMIKKKDENVDFDFVFKYKPYEIEKLLKRRDIERNIMYLIKWKDCGNEHNVWYPVHALQKAQNLMNECDARIDDLIYDKRINARQAPTSDITTNPFSVTPLRKRDRPRKT